jgi:hypothetical protein
MVVMRNALSALSPVQRFLIDFTATFNVPAVVAKITSFDAQGVTVSSVTKAIYRQVSLLLRPGDMMVCIGLPRDIMVIAGTHPIMMCTNSWTSWVVL